MNANSPIAVGLREFPMTLGLVTVCVVLFIWQVLTGVNPSLPNNAELLKWGANFLPYTLSNQPWRMISSLFLHIGLLHLIFNMFALYYFGQVAERMFGSVNVLMLFLLSGIGGNLLNNYLSIHQVLANDVPAVSAGASGGIMGIGMALLVVALSKKAINGLQLSANSLLWVMAINLGYGFFVGGIDNAGHVGGAVTGLLLGLAYIFQFSGTTTPMSSNQALYQPKVWAVYGIISLLFGLIFWQLHQQFMNLLTSQYAQMNI